jgi:hypothetical protein
MQKRTAPQRYASCILRLEQLTPHQKEKVQELFDADEVRITQWIGINNDE